ncbi:hypothetical protein GOODEAATRI_030965 [Goodea atripinnis]|uniref:Vitellogenin n=1 Tax=Goodea atripinnis TaxID=208336 RepID=A0ABV0PII7_9TELE
MRDDGFDVEVRLETQWSEDSNYGYNMVMRNPDTTAAVRGEGDLECIQDTALNAKVEMIGGRIRLHISPQKTRDNMLGRSIIISRLGLTNDKWQMCSWYMDSNYQITVKNQEKVKCGLQVVKTTCGWTVEMDVIALRIEKTYELRLEEATNGVIVESIMFWKVPDKESVLIENKCYSLFTVTSKTPTIETDKDEQDDIILPQVHTTQKFIAPTTIVSTIANHINNTNIMPSLAPTKTTLSALIVKWRVALTNTSGAEEITKYGETVEQAKNTELFTLPEFENVTVLPRTSGTPNETHASGLNDYVLIMVKTTFMQNNTVNLLKPNQTKYGCSEKEGCHDYQGGLDKFYMERRDNKVTPRAINKLQDIKWHGLRPRGDAL